MVLSLADGMTAESWLPPIVRTVAARGEGIEELLGAIEKHLDWMRAQGMLDARRRAQLKLRVETILKDRVLAAASAQAGLEAEVERGFARHLDPYRLADTLFEGVVRAEAARVGAREEER
jgi:LAO/AO transport system kinase